MKKISLLFVFFALVLTIVGCTTKVTVSFDTAGGDAIPSVQMNSGEKVQLPTPERDGYIFQGWFLDGKPFDASTKVENNITLTARWKKENPGTLHVTFMVDGSEYAKKDVLEEELLTDLPKNPTKEDYQFLGWYVEDQLFDFAKTPVTSDLVVTAKFDQTHRIVINEVSLPTDLVKYTSNKGVKENKRTEFMDREVEYLVGTENAWKFMPNVDFLKQNLANPSEVTDVVVNSWEYVITIYQLSVSDKDPIDLATSNLIDSVDDVKCLIDFSDEAINQTFKVEVYPTGLTENQLPQLATRYTVSFEIKVVDGYNVYSAKELGYMENGGRGKTEFNEAWTTFKDANNLQKNYAPEALILHTDIEVTKDDVPSIFFFTEAELKEMGVENKENAVGSMKDWKDMYYHVTEADHEFHLYGNYYTLSTEHLREVVLDTSEDDVPDLNAPEVLISHATLIRFVGQGDTSLEDLNIIGNAQRTDELVKSGGQILIKIEGPNFKAYNNITTCSFISYMPNRTDAVNMIEKCRAYDNFNCFVYNWGSPNVTIKNSEMIGAGGPIIIQDHVGHDVNGEGGNPSSTVVIESKLESFVTGSEGWFKAVNATAIVPAVTGIGTILKAQGQRSFLTTSPTTGYENFNFICANKSGSGETITAVKIKGSLKIDSNPAFDYGATDPMFKAIYDQILQASGETPAPIFQTSAGGVGFFDGKTVKNPLTQSDSTADDNVFKGDYLCIYYNGMALIFGYYAA